MTYKLDQDTHLEILEEWSEPEEYDPDDYLHDEIARDEFYNPNRRVSKIKNNNSKQRKANNMQLVNTQNQINTIHSSSSIIDIDQIDEDTKALSYAICVGRNVSAYEKIDNDHTLSDEEKINKKIKYQNTVDFSNELKRWSLGQFAKLIYHYTSQMINPMKQKYPVIVDEPSYYKEYHYFNSYIRKEDSSRPSGYDTEMLGFAHRAFLVWFPSDKDFPYPTYRIRVGDTNFIRDVNKLFEMLSEYSAQIQFTEFLSRK